MAKRSGWRLLALLALLAGSLAWPYYPAVSAAGPGATLEGAVRGAAAGRPGLMMAGFGLTPTATVSFPSAIYPYVTPPPPSATPCPFTVADLKPAVIPADRPTLVKLSGTNFEPASLVQLGEAAPVAAAFISRAALTVQAPAGLATGWYTVTLTGGGGCTTTLANALRVEGPRLAALAVNGGALSTTALTVTLAASAAVTESAKIVGLSFSSDGRTWTPWADYAPATWVLPAGDGPKTVYARGKDRLGNVSAVISATVELDTAALRALPAPGVSINQGAYFANDVATALTLGAPLGTAQMLVSNDPAWAGARWEPYISHKAWTAAPAADPAVPSLVYVRYKDWRGAVSEPYQDEIVLDIQPPTGAVRVTGVVSDTAAGESRAYSFEETRYRRLAAGDGQKAGIFLPPAAPLTLSSPPATATVTAPAACPDCFTVELDLPAMDNLSGVGAMRLSRYPNFSDANWELYTVKKNWALPLAGATVYVQFRDFAGNMSPVYTAAVPPLAARALPRAASNHMGTGKVVLADYMMWYGPDTFDGKMTWDVPAAGPYHSGDPAIIRRQVAEAQQACLDGFAAHWYGPADISTTNNFDTLLAASAGTTLRHSIVIQTNILPEATEQMIIDAIKYTAVRWAQHPNYLRLGGRPVLTFTDMPRPWNDPFLALAAWQRIRAATDPGRAMIWMAEGLYPNYNPVFDGLYVYRIDHRDYEQGWLQQPRWAKGLRELEQDPKVRLPLGGLYFADSIAPGFDNTRLENSPINFSDPAPVFARDRREGGYYADTFAATALTGGDFLYVKSFNEWIEGTEIEPGLSYGDLYLNLTCQFANAYRGR